jgi:calcineurin-like phosphoesterase
VTLGNHWHSKQEIDEYLDDAEALVRPLNILNLPMASAAPSSMSMGRSPGDQFARAFRDDGKVVQPPVEAIEALFKENTEPCIHIVDYHADSTSEKAIFAYVYDGRVSAVIGTHTHVQTNDAEILPKAARLSSAMLGCAAMGGHYWL